MKILRKFLGKMMTSENKKHFPYAIIIPYETFGAFRRKIHINFLFSYNINWNDDTEIRVLTTTKNKYGDIIQDNLWCALYEDATQTLYYNSKFMEYVDIDFDKKSLTLR